MLPSTTSLLRETVQSDHCYSSTDVTTGLSLDNTDVGRDRSDVECNQSSKETVLPAIEKQKPHDVCLVLDVNCLTLCVPCLVPARYSERLLFRRLGLVDNGLQNGTFRIANLWNSRPIFHISPKDVFS